MSIAGLNPAVPADTAFAGDGAAEIRALKAALTAVLPGLDVEVTKPSDYGVNTGSTTVTSADLSQLFTDIAGALSPTVSNALNIPLGTISMWYGNLDAAKETELNSIGWFLCNGVSNNGVPTPDLTDKFVKGWSGGTQDLTALPGAGGTAVGNLATTGTYDVGTALTTQDDKVLTSDTSFQLGIANIPQHNHGLFVPETNDTNNVVANPYTGKIAAEGGSGNYDGAASHIARDYRGASATGSNTTIGTTGDAGQLSPTAVTVDTGATSGQFAHEHAVTLSGDLEPSHLRLAYICYCGVS